MFVPEEAEKVAAVGAWNRRIIKEGWWEIVAKAKGLGFLGRKGGERV